MIKSIRLRCAGHVARVEENKSAFKILTGRPIGKRPSGTEDNVRMDLKWLSIRGIGLIRLRIGVIGEFLWMWY